MPAGLIVAKVPDIGLRARVAVLESARVRPPPTAGQAWERVLRNIDRRLTWQVVDSGLGIGRASAASAIAVLKSAGPLIAVRAAAKFARAYAAAALVMRDLPEVDRLNVSMGRLAGAVALRIESDVVPLVDAIARAAEGIPVLLGRFLDGLRSLISQATAYAVAAVERAVRWLVVGPAARQTAATAEFGAVALARRMAHIDVLPPRETFAVRAQAATDLRSSIAAARDAVAGARTAAPIAPEIPPAPFQEISEQLETAMEQISSDEIWQKTIDSAKGAAGSIEHGVTSVLSVVGASIGRWREKLTVGIPGSFDAVVRATDSLNDALQANVAMLRAVAGSSERAAKLVQRAELAFIATLATVFGAIAIVDGVAAAIGGDARAATAFFTAAALYATSATLATASGIFGRTGRAESVDAESAIGSGAGIGRRRESDLYVMVPGYSDPESIAHQIAIAIDHPVSDIPASQSPMGRAPAFRIEDVVRAAAIAAGRQTQRSVVNSAAGASGMASGAPGVTNILALMYDAAIQAEATRSARRAEREISRGARRTEREASRAWRRAKKIF